MHNLLHCYTTTKQCFRLCKQMDMVIDGSNAQQIANSLQGCVELRYRPPDAFVVSLMQRLADNLQQGASEWKPMHVSSSLLWCYHLACALPCDVLLSLLQTMCDASQVDTQAATNTLFAVCGLLCIEQNHATLKQCLPLLCALARRITKAGNMEHANQLLLANLACAAMGVDQLLTAALLKECHLVKQCPTDTTISKLQRQVVKAIGRLQVDHGQHLFKEVLVEHPVLEGTSHVDALCVTQEGKQVVVEVDGPTHFFANETRMFNGPSRLKHALLRHQGYATVSVHYLDWEKAGQDNKAQEGLLWGLITSVGS